MNIYQYTDYKKFVNDWMKSRPKSGHGEFRRFAMALNVSTTMMSQVFRGDKHISLEMACELADCLSLTEEESDFFLLLVNYKKSGSYKLEKKYLKRIQEISEKNKKVSSRVKADLTISEIDKAIYYSSWMYGAIRILSTINGLNDAEKISEYLKLPKNKIVNAIDFLNKAGLISLKAGRISEIKGDTFIPQDHPLVNRHHQNWRQLAFQKMQVSESDDLFFTGPITLSKEAVEEIRSILLESIKKTKDIVSNSDAQLLKCLNIDFFSI